MGSSANFDDARDLGGQRVALYGYAALQDVLGAPALHGFPHAKTGNASWVSTESLDAAKVMEFTNLVRAAIAAFLWCLVAARPLIRHRPSWCSAFAQESHFSSAFHTPQKKKWTYWTVYLIVVAAAGLLQAIFAAVAPPRNLFIISDLMPWVGAVLITAIDRPSKTPKTLLCLYLSIFACGIVSTAFSYKLHGYISIPTVVDPLISLVALIGIVAMPMRDPRLGEDGIAHSDPSYELRSPEDNLTLWKFMTVSWMGPLIARGSEKQLHDEDVWQLPFDFQHDRLHTLFRDLRGSMMTKLISANGMDLIIQSCLGIIETAANLSIPILLKQLLQSIQGGDQNVEVSVLYATAILAVRLAACQSAVFQLWYSRRCYERSRGEMITTLYAKTLSRKFFGQPAAEQMLAGDGVANGDANHDDADDSNADSESASRFRKIISWFRSPKKNNHKYKKVQEHRQPATTGKILNLMRSDVYEVAQRFWEFPTLVTKPLQFILSFVLVWQLLGWPCVLGMACVIVAQVLNTIFIAQLLKKERLRRAATDARLQSTSQFVEGIRHLRWYDWQSKWLDSIMVTRQHELNTRIVTGLWRIAIATINVASGTLFPVATFFAYTFLAGKTLTVDVAFPALQLFAMLETSFKELPNLITVVLNASIAMGRIEQFMDEPDKDGVYADHLTNDIKFTKASFVWPGYERPVLRNLDLTFPQGLTVVFGKVGSGKSALLQAILGELDCPMGDVIIPTEPIGFCAQSPWLQHMSIRDNILFSGRYRDLIDSADSIVLMKSSCESISSNIASIQTNIRSLSASPVSETPKFTNPNPARLRIYGIACCVKYLVDTPENIWGCLDESMFLEAAGRYIRGKHVHYNLVLANNANANSSAEWDHTKILSNFPLLQHQWQIVEGFKAQISQRSRERLLDPALEIAAYADALAGVAVIDELDPKQVLGLFLDTRKSWILQKLATFGGNDNHAVASEVVVLVFCEVLKIIQVSVGQVGELFLQVLNDMPLFYKVILCSPPASQLFGGIPYPDGEVRLWKLFRERLESAMVILDKQYIARTCMTWLRDSGGEVVSNINGKYLIDAIATGGELSLAEKLIRETMDSKHVLQGSLDWLKSVFGSEIELPWSRIRELFLEDDSDLWDEIFEDAFVQRMKAIINSAFEDLTKIINVENSICTIGEAPSEHIDYQAYLNRPTTGGGVWFIESNGNKSSLVSGYKASPEENDFQSCLSAYFGPEVSQIRDAVDSRCQSVLEDLLNFLETPKAVHRLKDLGPFLQDKCYDIMSTILAELKRVIDQLNDAMENSREGSPSVPPAIVVERSLFVGRLLFAFQNHTKHIPVILGSPRFWSKDTVSAVFDKLPSVLRQSQVATDSLITESPGRQTPTGSRQQTSCATAALLGASEHASPKLEELARTTRDLSIRAHNLWILWLSDELSAILGRDLGKDDGLSAITPLRGWDETVVKQEQSDENHSEMKISLPSMPSFYIISFLFRACEEIHRIGGHVLDKSILQKFALRLLEKLIEIYEDFLSGRGSHASQVSEKGVLQILLDLKFAADVLSGSESNINEDLSKSPMMKVSFRRKQGQSQTKSVFRERIEELINRFSQKLDPIDWLTYEPYLWENERQSYLRHAVLFGFFVQLNRMYTDTVQKLPSNPESNIMRCSIVPRFKYLPISAPALSSRGTPKTSIPAVSDDISSRSSWKAYTNGEFSQKISLDDNSSFGVAAPILKSFMQVGSRFGESTLKLGSILTDGQVGIFKDRSAAAMSTFGDILPAQAAGLLSSFTATRSDS